MADELWCVCYWAMVRAIAENANQTKTKSKVHVYINITWKLIII